MEYGDILYHHTPSDSNQLLPLSVKNLSNTMTKLESVQYQAALIVTGAWQGSSKEKLYKELGWEFLCRRRWLRQLSLFFKIVNGRSPQYLNLKINLSSRLRNLSKLIKNVHTRTKRYERSFYPSCIYSWNNILTAEQRTATNSEQFKSTLNALIKPIKTDNFGVSYKKDLKYLYQMRVGLSALKMHKYLHNFSDTNGTQCPFLDGTEDNFHFLIVCKKFYSERKVLFNTVYNVCGINLLLTPREKIVNLLLYGEPTFSKTVNKSILLATIEYVQSTGRLSKL